MAQYYAIIDANGAFTGRTYSDADIPTKTSENWPGSLAEPSAHHRPIEDQPDEFHTWDDKINKWILSDLILTGFKTETIQRIKSLGEQRVYSEYGPHAQARLGVSTTSKDDAERAKCHALIEAVRAVVDSIEVTITGATTVAAINATQEVFRDALGEI